MPDRNFFSSNEFDLGTEASHDFEKFFELSADLLCIAGFDGYFKRINPAVSKLLGYSNEELFSKPIHEFIHEEDRHITSRVRAELIKSKPLLNFENRYLTKGGEEVWLSWTSMPVESENLVFAIAKNITHKKKLEQDRNVLLENLTRMNHELKQLTYTTSHDLRSPVNNLLSVFEILDVSKIEDEETAEFVRHLKTASQSLSETLNGYVDLLAARESLRVQSSKVKFEDSLKLVMNAIHSLTATTKAIVNSDFSKLESVYFDKVYLESVFLNLLTNSIKYAKPDVVPVITISSRMLGDVPQLIFADNGIGFDMELAKNKIFGFNQKFHNHIDSKGIGLYLVHSHVNSLGGTIAVESQVNVGTTFTISFSS